MASWTIETLIEVFIRLLDADVEFVVIGGQAVNLWSRHYSEPSDSLSTEWRQFEPFPSRDLDCLGDGMVAQDAGQAFGVEVPLYPPFGRTTGPNSGTFEIPLPEGSLLVHFLHTPYGASPDEVRRTARTHQIGHKKHLPVMHPLLCLETKVACLFGLDQRGRQDLKHVQLSCLVFREYVRERLRMGVTKDVLLAAERIGRLACNRMGLSLWGQYSIPCDSYLPLDSIRHAAVSEPKLASFVSLRWPIIETKIRDRRSKFLSILDAAGNHGLSAGE